MALNIKKAAEKGRKIISGKNWRYDLGQEDIINIAKEAKANITDGTYSALVLAFHIGLLQGAKIAQKGAQA